MPAQVKAIPSSLYQTSKDKRVCVDDNIFMFLGSSLLELKLTPEPSSCTGRNRAKLASECWFETYPSLPSP